MRWAANCMLRGQQFGGLKTSPGRFLLPKRTSLFSACPIPAWRCSPSHRGESHTPSHHNDDHAKIDIRAAEIDGLWQRCGRLVALARWHVFRLLSTGQIYRVDDYGWALAGRNTIDLYMASQREMNNWGARHESIEILHWGDSQESLRLLSPHTNYRHIRRMALELEGRDREAAALQ
jgi:hypothetical protein